MDGLYAIIPKGVREAKDLRFKKGVEKVAKKGKSSALLENEDNSTKYALEDTATNKEEAFTEQDSNDESLVYGREGQVKEDITTKKVDFST